MIGTNQKGGSFFASRPGGPPVITSERDGSALTLHSQNIVIEGAVRLGRYLLGPNSGGSMTIGGPDDDSSFRVNAKGGLYSSGNVFAPWYGGNPGDGWSLGSKRVVSSDGKVTSSLLQLSVSPSDYFAVVGGKGLNVGSADQPAGRLHVRGDARVDDVLHASGMRCYGDSVIKGGLIVEQAVDVSTGLKVRGVSSFDGRIRIGGGMDVPRDEKCVVGDLTVLGRLRMSDGDDSYTKMSSHEMGIGLKVPKKGFFTLAKVPVSSFKRSLRVRVFGCSGPDLIDCESVLNFGSSNMVRSFPSSMVCSRHMDIHVTKFGESHYNVWFEWKGDQPAAFSVETEAPVSWPGGFVDGRGTQVFDAKGVLSTFLPDLPKVEKVTTGDIVSSSQSSLLRTIPDPSTVDREAGTISSRAPWAPDSLCLVGCGKSADSTPKDRKITLMGNAVHLGSVDLSSSSIPHRPPGKAGESLGSRLKLSDNGSKHDVAIGTGDSGNSAWIGVPDSGRIWFYIGEKPMLRIDSGGMKLMTGTKDFEIPHPLGYGTLNHSCIEAPRPELVYRGTETFVGKIRIDVDASSRMIPGTFAAITECESTPNSLALTLNSSHSKDVRVSGMPPGVGEGSFDILCSDPYEEVTVTWVLMAVRKTESPFVADSIFEKRNQN